MRGIEIDIQRTNKRKSFSISICECYQCRKLNEGKSITSSGNLIGIHKKNEFNKKQSVLICFSFAYRRIDSMGEKNIRWNWRRKGVNRYKCEIHRNHYGLGIVKNHRFEVTHWGFFLQILVGPKRENRRLQSFDQEMNPNFHVYVQWQLSQNVNKRKRFICNSRKHWKP